MDDRTSFTWRDLSEQVRRGAGWLQQSGIGSGDHVVFTLPNWSEYLVLHFAAVYVGAISVFAPLAAGPEDWRYMVQTADASAVITPGRWRDVDYRLIIETLERPLRHLIVNPDQSEEGESIDNRRLAQRTMIQSSPSPTLGPHDVYLLNFTSGTTSRPRCVMNTQSRRLLLARAVAEHCSMDATDLVLSVVPIGPGFSIYASHGISLVSGAGVILQERWDPALALQAVRERRPSMLMAVPSQAAKMLDALPSALEAGSLRVCYLSGSLVAPDLARRVEETFSCTFITGYGTTESGLVSALCLQDPPEKRWNTVGKPDPRSDVVLIAADGGAATPGETGEIASRGPYAFGGYYHDLTSARQLFNEDGYYMTGDLGVMDPDGYLRVTGRIKDVIIRGGQNISASEVEHYLLTQPDIVDAAVVAMPDPVLGERSCAYIVSRAPTMNLQDVTRHLAALGVSKYKFPERVELLAELPMSLGGKVRKDLLRQDIAAKLAQEGSRERPRTRGRSSKM